MSTYLLNFLLNVLFVAFLSKYLPGFHVSDFYSAFIFVAFLSIMNIFIKPVLILLTLPLQILSFGLFTVFVNAGIVWFLANSLKGVNIDNFAWAMICAVLLSLFNIVLHFLNKR